MVPKTKNIFLNNPFVFQTELPQQPQQPLPQPQQQQQPQQQKQNKKLLRLQQPKLRII